MLLTSSDNHQTRLGQYMSIHHSKMVCTTMTQFLTHSLPKMARMAIFSNQRYKYRLKSIQCNTYFFINFNWIIRTRGPNLSGFWVTNAQILPLVEYFSKISQPLDQQWCYMLLEWTPAHNITFFTIYTKLSNSCSLNWVEIAHLLPSFYVLISLLQFGPRKNEKVHHEPWEILYIKISILSYIQKV